MYRETHAHFREPLYRYKREIVNSCEGIVGYILKPKGNS